MPLETNLRHALQRESPAPGFASRVMRRIESHPEASRPPARRWRAVAAAVLVVTISGSWAVHREMERRAGERAADDALRALRIASEKINHAEKQVRDIGRSAD